MGLKEYSVVYTDRAINHMSPVFCETMKNIDGMMKRAYNASGVVIMPGSGTYGMEAVARQWCSGKKALVIRNGYFSYRWTDIFEQTQIPSETIVMRGRAVDDEKTPAFAPPRLAEVVEMINKEKPAVVFAPHVETSTGIILPDSYIKAVADAVHAHGGLFVLDSIASGTIWVDMKATGVDAILSAPQKGWSGVRERDHARRTRRARDAQLAIHLHGHQHAQVARSHGCLLGGRVRVLHHHAHRRVDFVRT